MSTTGRNIVEDAFAELNVFAAGDAMPAEDADYGIRRLARIFGLWNANPALSSYADAFTSYTLTPSLQPHTIGPSGTFTAIRPNSIDGANYISGSGTSAIRYPISIRDRDWWYGLPMKGLMSTIPTDLYYEPTLTNGSLYLYPVPSSAVTLELMTKRLLSELVLTDTFTLPHGYQEAVTLTLAEALAPAYGKPVSPDLKMAAGKARATIMASHAFVPRLATHDAGMPGRDAPCGSQGSGWRW